jgi:hypothetical protein
MERTQPSTQPPTHRDLASIKAGEQGIVFAVARRIRESQASNGKPFLDLELGDTSGSRQGKVWSDVGLEMFRTARDIQPGSAVKLRFVADTYKDQVQLRIASIRAAQPEEFDPEILFGKQSAAASGLAARHLVIDIETAATQDIRALPQTVVEAVTRFAEMEGGDKDRVTALSPLLSRVISLAVGDAHGEGGTVLFAPPTPEDFPDPPEWIRVVTEPELLTAFWDLASQAESVVTFNGRRFDVPFLLVRSAIHGVPVRVDLMSDRYGVRPHLDLRWLLTGGERGNGPFSLDTVCFAFGIDSPKEAMDGSMVGKAFQAGRFVEIARYNLADVAATRALFQRLEGTVLKFRKDWGR